MAARVIRPHPMARHHDDVYVRREIVHQLSNRAINCSIDLQDGAGQGSMGDRIVTRMCGVQEVPALMPDAMRFGKDSEQKIPGFERQTVPQQGRFLSHAVEETNLQILIVRRGASRRVTEWDALKAE